MSAIFANRIARRRAIAFVALLATSLVLIAVSGSRAVVDLQNGIGFAFRPMEGALRGLGQNLTSMASALAEIDQLRLENEALRAENERIRTENRQAEELRRLPVREARECQQPDPLRDSLQESQGQWRRRHDLRVAHLEHGRQHRSDRFGRTGDDQRGAGVCQRLCGPGVERTGEGFRLSHERPWWRFWHNGDQVFRAQPGDRVVVFFRIFSPARFADRVRMRWYWEPGGRGWLLQDSIPIDIVGGREQGFRGYGFKANYQPGRWKVQVETEDGREIGRVYFTLESVAEAPRMLQTDVE